MKKIMCFLLCISAINSFAENEFTNDLTTVHSGGIKSGSSNYYSSYTPANAFDDIIPVPTGTAGRWLAVITGGVSAWTQYQFPNGGKYAVGSYTIWNSTYSSWTIRAPQDFYLSGSSNGTDWVTIDTRINETNWLDAAEDRTYFCANTTAYEYYRLTVTTNNGDKTYMGISELALFEAPTGPPVAPVAVSPTNSSVDVGLSGNLLWDSDVSAESNIVYLGKNTILTEADILGVTAEEVIAYTDLDGSTLYYWMVVSVNNNGATTGAVSHFTTTFKLPELIAYEGFESYATGPLSGAGLTGGGWTGSWVTATSAVQIVSESMSYSGGQVYVNGGSKATYYTQLTSSPLLQRDFTPIAYGPAYMSVLVKGHGMQNDVNSFVLRDMNYTGGPDGIPHSLGMDFARADDDSPPGYIDAEVYGSTSRVRGFTSVSPTNEVTYFVVVRLQRAANGEYETAEVIVNPTTTTEPVTGWTSATYEACSAATLSAFAVRAAVMDTGDWITFDELRIGTTYESVVPRRLTGTVIVVF